MKRVFKLLKPVLPLILISVVLLFIQARLELRLPDYTANIVNTGIQQNGIDKSIFEKVSKDTLNNVLFYTEDDDEILSYYSLEHDEKLDRDVYVLNVDVNKKKLEKLLIDSMFIYNITLNYKDNIPSDGSSNFSYSKDDYNNFLKGVSSISTSIKRQSNVKLIVDEYKALKINVEKKQMNYLMLSGVKMLIISFAIMLVAILIAYLSSSVGSRFARDLRESLVKKIMSFSNKEYEEFSTASLITRTTNDVQQVQMFLVMMLRIVIFAPLLGLGALSKVWGSSLSWVIGLAVLTLFILIIVLFTIAFPKFKLIQKVIDKVNLVSREILTGLPVIRAFSNEKHEEKRFDKANKDLTNINLFVNRIMVFMMPFMSFIMNAVSVLIIWVGAKSVDTGSMQVGDLMAFITYAIQIIISFIMISIVSIILPRAIVSLRRIIEVLNKEASIKDPANPKNIKHKDNITIKFNDVSFMYPDANENVIEHISFEARPNTTTAIIGSTGCGKSTLINLIPRFFDVTEGSITINDTNIKDVRLSDLRKLIGYVPQRGNLFKGTIKSNIKFSSQKISEADMVSAAKIAQASEFINKKKNKYNDDISEGGSNVSGGQKQRLAIARALALKPKVLIFDDSFSAVDYKTDSKLRSSIKKHVKDVTTLIVAQRISTILDADQIIVLEDGKIVGKGTHKELMKNNKVYREIALSQLSEEELS